MLYLGGHTEESISAIPYDVKNMLIAMAEAGIIGPNAGRINSYRISSTIFDLLRIVYSFAGGKKSLTFPTFKKFAPESDVPALMEAQNPKEPEAMSAEEVERRLWRWSQQLENTTD